MDEDAPPPATFDRVSWPVRTTRLTIRPVTADDFPRLYEIRAAPGVTRWLTNRPTSYDDYVERYGTPERLANTLVSESEDGIVGDLFLALGSAWAQTEVRDRARDTEAIIGWVVDPAYAGRGYATEGAEALLAIAFGQLGVRRVVAAAFADNTASVRIMEKIGMRIESRAVRASLHRDLGWQDHLSCAILAEEWHHRHERTP